MPKPLSVASVIDKNKITSDVVWAILLTIEVVDPNTRGIVDVVRIARNNEAIVFDGEVYQPANFEISVDQRQNQAASVSLAVQDQSRYIHQRLEEMAGGVFSNVLMKVINTSLLNKPPEIEERFEVTSSNVKQFVVTFQLGAENPLGIQFPKHTQRQDRCAWRYRGYGCGYAGAMPTCSYTKEGPVGCKAHGNFANFRGLSGLVNMNI